MGSPTPTPRIEFSGEQSTSNKNNKVQKVILIFRLIDAPPTLPLPTTFKAPGFEKSSITFNNTEINLIPKIDLLMEEYSVRRCEILFTLKLVELINQQHFLFAFGSITDRLEYAVTFYLKLNTEPIGGSTQGIRNILSNYIETLYAFKTVSSNKPANLLKLKNSLQKLEETFLNDIKKVTYLRKNHKTSTEVGEKSAKWFIDRVNADVDKAVKEYFIYKKAQLIQNLPEAIINDHRFKMSLEDPHWNDYDEIIKTEVAAYNNKFSTTTGYKPLDWQLVKAMVWTEVFAGPENDKPQWKKNPMQIGRFRADPGAAVVKNGRENSDLVTSPELRTQLQNSITGNNNIKAAVAYLYTIALRNNVEWREVIDNPAIETYSVQSSDTLDKIAKKKETTTDNIVKNSGINKTDILKLGKELKYQKAHLERTILGWADWLAVIRDYNGNRDPEYMNKINRAYEIIKSRE